MQERGSFMLDRATYKPIRPQAAGRLAPALCYGILAAAVSALFCAVSSGSAQAQQTAEGPQANQELEEVTVTGTLIRATGMTTPTPVTVMRSEELSAMSPGHLIDSLDQLPQFLNNAKPESAASKADSAGASNLNMRSLGSKRTLVLLDGRRIVPSNRLGLVDINLFPEALLERVETVTGGASAAYGTDAVAGTVNFLLNDDYTGVKTHLQGGATTRDDRDNWEFSIAGGTPIGERGHLIASFEQYEADRISNIRNRDWYKGTGTVTNPEFLEDGSLPRLLIRDNVRSTIYSDGGVIDAPGTSIDRLQFDEFGRVVPFVFGDYASVGEGTQNMVGGSGFNATDFDRSVSTPAYPNGTRSCCFFPSSERQNGFVRFTFDVTEDLSVFADALVGDTETNSVGTLPIGHSIWALSVYPENAFLPDSISEAMAEEGIESFRLQRYHTAKDIAQDRFIMRNETRSLSVGFDLEFSGGGWLDGWVLEGYYQDGTNDNELDFNDFINREKLPLAMDAVVDPETGDIVCNVTLFQSGYEDCVPVNLFGTGQASQAAIDYVTDSMQVRAETTQENAQVGLSGDIAEGWGAGPVSLALGASWREQSITHRIGPDVLVNQPGLANDPANGIRGIPLAWQGTDDRLQFVDLENFDGSFDVKEIYAETLLPLVSGAAAAEQLNLSLAGRLADYEGSGNIEAWKAGFDWQINEQLRLRTTASRDVRAASLEERFDRQGQGTSIDDPEFDELSYTTFQIRGGNPEVNPEEADTFTIGAVWQPPAAENFSLSVDWYDIEVDGAIDFLGTQEIVDQCFETGADEFCNRITRDPDTGFVTLIQNTFANVDKAKVSGVDVEMSLNREIDWLGTGGESLNWRFLASYLGENSVTEADAPKRDLAGEVGGAGLPEWQWTSNATYSNGPFSLFLQGRWFDSGVDDIDWVEGVDIADNTIESMFYTDARASYTGPTRDGQWEAFLHVANLFDEDPPLSPGWSTFGGTGFGTNGSLYDMLGRRFTLGFRVEY